MSEALSPSDFNGRLSVVNQVTESCGVRKKDAILGGLAEVVLAYNDIWQWRYSNSDPNAAGS